MICPKCGEDNSDTFRFCGMCGTLLEPRLETRVDATRVEARRPVGAPVPNLPTFVPPSSPPEQSKTANTSESVHPLVVENAPVPANKPVPPISGPSMLGLDRPGSQFGPNQPANQPTHQPTMDSLRERSFSGLDSFFEPEQPKNGGRRILLMVVLLAALGGAGWWAYTNYLGAAEPLKPDTATSSTSESPAEAPSTNSEAKIAAAAPSVSSSPAAGPPPAAPSGQAPEGLSENADAAPDVGTKPATPAPSTKIAPTEKIAAKREPGLTSARASKADASRQTAPQVADTGDADFRKADAFLYGRGAAENCDQAVKYLKAASAKSNAKARSAFGTMYATGHCVPRDLPTSYLWFALALQVDPNNQILEKDLNSVWSEMTPPERQLATRMKQ